MALNTYAKHFVNPAGDDVPAAMNSAAVGTDTVPRIFCDLDGVLCDFDRGCVDELGKMPDQLARKTMWQGLARANGFCKWCSMERFLILHRHYSGGMLMCAMFRGSFRVSCLPHSQFKWSVTLQ